MARANITALNVGAIDALKLEESRLIIVIRLTGIRDTRGDMAGGHMLTRRSCQPARFAQQPLKHGDGSCSARMVGGWTAAILAVRA